MNAILKSALAIAAVAISAHAVAEITLYEREDFRGQSFTTEGPVGNLERFAFNDRASSALVTGKRWEVCEDARFSGRCMILRPGRYPSLAAMGLNNRISSARDVDWNAGIDDGRFAPPAIADRDYIAGGEIIFYEHQDFRGKSFNSRRPIGNLERFGFNDRASSVVVIGDQWEVCEDARFSGRCMILRPGRYPSLAAMGLNNRISSARDLSGNARIDDNRYTPPPVTIYDNR